MSIYKNIISKSHFEVPKDWLSIQTIDMHTCGEPLRVILSGLPSMEGNSVLENRAILRNQYDHFRTALTFEPRGHADMYGCILTPPNDEGADFGIIFLHNEGYSTMCGHAIIGITTLAMQMNWIEVKEGENMLKIDAPCGRITAYAQVQAGRTTGVRFHCVPSFVAALDKKIKIAGKDVIYDLAYGGAFYAYVDMTKNDFDFDLTKNSYKELIQTGMRIKHAVMESDKDIVHPFENELSFLYGTIFIGNPLHPENQSRNVCIFADGEVDRCPTGSGVSGRMAIRHARKELAVHEKIKIESIIDTVFEGSIFEETSIGKHVAVIPEVSGDAFITGQHTFLIDPNDPLKEGFLLR